MRNRLDSTAIVHCSLMNENWINTYRITITMDDAVDRDALQAAADRLMERYPTICSRIVKDSFWYYTEKLNRINVRALDCGLLESIDCENIGSRAVNLMYDGNKIIFEAFHSVTDGHGAFTYLNALLGVYVQIKSGKQPGEIDCGSFTQREAEDAFMRYGNSKVSRKTIKKINNPYFFEKHKGNITKTATVFRMKTEHIKSLSKINRCSMNDFLVATIFKALSHLPGTEGKDIAFIVPVNLRRYFETQSVLNFTYLSNAALSSGERKMEIKDMAKEIRRQVDIRLNMDFLRNAVSQIAFANRAMAVAPLFIKDFIIRSAISMGYEKTCMTVTNLGNTAAMLPAADCCIKNVDVMISPRRSSPYNCVILSHKDELKIVLTHTAGESLLVHALCRQLETMGILFETGEMV